MSRLKLQMQVSVDGFDANGPNEDVDWNEIRAYSRDLLDSSDTIVLGRKTAVEFIPYWDSAAANPDNEWHDVAQRIAAARKVVFSKTLDGSDWNNTDVENGDMAEAIKRLKNGNKKDIVVYGGTSFVSSLIREELIDEFHLFVNPVALGTGNPIFAELRSAQKFRLVKSIAYDCGLVLLNYEPRRR